MHRHSARVQIAIVMLLLAVLACDTVLARKTSGGQSINSCDLTTSLQYETSLLSRKTDSTGNRICQYRLTLKNPNSDFEITPMLYVHHADPYQHLDEHKWMQSPSVESGGSQEFRGNVTVYLDKDVNGRPGVNIAERIVGLKLDWADCWALKNDTEFLERHAATLNDPPCTLAGAWLPGLAGLVPPGP